MLIFASSKKENATKKRRRRHKQPRFTQELFHNSLQTKKVKNEKKFLSTAFAHGHE